MLAPMVRVGTLPMRLLALRYGADIVYGEEIIDHKMIHCTRVQNKLLGTVDYLASDGTVVFRTCEEEKEKLIFQMGTCDPERALRVAKMLEQDVSGIDINMGCPKEFSIKGGMGAALLTQPEKIKKILTTLVAGLAIPVTCKIRILPEVAATLELVKAIETTGVKALGVHGRWKEERSTSPCHCDYIKKISEVISIPLIANGGSNIINTYEDIEKFKKETKCNSVMLARAAMWNPSIFRKEGLLPVQDVAKEYVKLAIDYDSYPTNLKYVLCKMLGDTTRDEIGRKVQSARDFQDISAAYGLEEYRQKVVTERNILKQKLLQEDDGQPDAKRQKLDDKIALDVAFNRKLYPKTMSPVQLLYEHCRRKKMKQPVFSTVMNVDKLFKSEVLVDGRIYTPLLSERRKKSAEQAAAIVYLQYHNIHDGRVKS